MVETMNAALLGCQPSGIRRFTALAKAEPGCLFLTIGEPDFSTPEPIKEATKTALDQNLTHYPPGAGELYLRERISRFEQEQNGVSYSPEEILVVDGATEGLYLALRGILNPVMRSSFPLPLWFVRAAGCLIQRRICPYGYLRRSFPDHPAKSGAAYHRKKQSNPPQFAQQSYRRGLYPRVAGRGLSGGEGEKSLCPL